MITKQIIKDAYEKNTKIRTKLDAFGLGIDDIEVQYTEQAFFSKSEKPFIIGYSLSKNKVVFCCVLDF